MGGHVFENTEPIARGNVPVVVDIVKRELPSNLQKFVIADIGSAGFKDKSNDVDLFLDEQALIDHYNAEDARGAKITLAQYFAAKNYAAKITGRIVHIQVPYIDSATNIKRYAQVDIMIIPDAKQVAEWHQHGPRKMYDDPKFKPSHLFILLNSLGKFLNLKIDAFAGKVLRRDNNEVVADNRKAAAKLLLNPGAKADDLNSVASIMAALEGDPDKEGKLAQARQDVQRGTLTLPEHVTPGTAAWFRKMGHMV